MAKAPKTSDLVEAAVADIGSVAMQDVGIHEVYGTHYCRRISLAIGPMSYRLDVKQGGELMEPKPKEAKVDGRRLTYHITDSCDRTAYVACEIAAMIAVWKHSVARERTERALKEL
ncbi:MAG: hypothetical protein WCP55_16160 [Lentisphaerota bacterium]